MRSPWTRAAAVALATATVSALPFLNGCKTDVERTDEQASTEMDTATAALISDHPEAAHEAIDKTINLKGASPESQIHAHLLAAQADLDSASLLIDGPGGSTTSALAFRAVLDGKPISSTSKQTLSPEDRASLQGIGQRQIRIAQLLANMTQIGQQLVLNNIDIAGAKALDPVKAREELQKATTLAQKGDNGVWFAGTAPLASLDALKAHEQDLQKQIGDLTAQRNDLNSKRGQALEQAGKFSQQADSSTGSASVGFFTQASNARKEAADDEVKMAQLDAQLTSLQQDLALVQVQEKSLDGIIAAYGEQLQQVENSWKDVQSRIDQATNLSKELLERAEPPAPAPAAAPADATGATSAPPVVITPMPHSLNALAAELDAQLKQVQTLRARAVTLLNSAYKHYDQALGLGATLTKSLTALSTGPDAIKLPERRAWQDLIALNSPAYFKLQQAGVEERLGGLYADQYAELAERNRVTGMLSAAIKQSGAQMPPAMATLLLAEGPVSPDVDSQVKQFEGDLRSDQPPYEKDANSLNELASGQTSPASQQALAAAQADVAFHWAGSLLDDVVKNAGQSDIASLLVNVAHAALMPNDYAEAQFALLQGKEQDAKMEMSAALEERRTLVDANAQYLLPSDLPPGLAFEVKPMAVAPAAPTSAPAVPGATAAAPAGADEQEVVRITNEYFAALTAGQTDKLQALSTPFPQMAEVLPAASDALTSVGAYKAAVKAKFGDAGNVLTASIPDIQPDLADIHVTINGNKAKVTSPKDPDVLDLTKTDGGWKVDPPPAMAIQMLQQMKPMFGVLKAVTPDIQAGKYPTVQDLIKDMGEKMKAAGVSIPEPGAMTTPTAGTTPPPETPPTSAPAPAPGTTQPAQ